MRLERICLKMAAMRQFRCSIVAFQRRFISTVTALTEVDKETRGELQDVLSTDFGAIAPVSGFPEEHMRRRVRIYAHSRNAMQSGTHASRHWRLDFDVQQRWENPLIGWTSTCSDRESICQIHVAHGKCNFFVGKHLLSDYHRHLADPVSNVHVEFDTADEAIKFAEKNGWLYEVDKKQEVKPKWKSYGDNFSWNRKTRVPTK